MKTTTISKEQAVEILNEIAWLLELKGENRFKVIAFENAARVLAGHPSDLKTLIGTGELETLKGIGRGRIAGILHDLHEKGASPEYEELKKEFPATLFELFHIPGLGSKRIKLLYEKLGITSIADLEKACQQNRLLDQEGLGQKTQENILRGIEQIRQHSGKFLIDTAIQESAVVVAYLSQQPGLIKIQVAGSVRRCLDVVHDIDILAAAKKPAEIHKAFTHSPEVTTVLAEGETKSSVVLKSGIQCDLRTVTEEEFPTALYYFTGSKEHNVAARTMAKKHNIKINEYGIFKGSRRLPVQEEADVFKVLGLHDIPPELRENTGEIEWAAQKELPKLVELADIRGVLHVHTDYSDGTASLARMVAHAQGLGYEYIGISDHSQSAKYAGGLEPERLRRQWKEIDKLQKTSKIRIFKGVESDILPDGKLDYPDDVLAGMDFVIGSVHSGFNMPVDKMTQRVLRAMDNKYLTIVGHPTGRILLKRQGYPIDVPALLKAAQERGIVMELNAHPSRLDLDWHNLHEAKKQGVLISINPDAHALEGFKDIAYGVGIARKGWLEKKDVFNALSALDVEKFFSRKNFYVPPGGFVVN
jgi:DNA polymerase (family 10)